MTATFAAPSLSALRTVFNERRDLIAAALAHAPGLFEVEDVWDEIVGERMQLWYTPHAVVVTEMHQFPRKKVCHVFLAAGVMAEIRALAPVVEQWARERGATAMRQFGRKGWTRSWLTADGWRETHRIMEKAL